MHVNDLSREDRLRRLKSSFAKGDQAKPHPNDPRAMMISSESHPGLLHYARPDFCDCEGFTLRGMCRHSVRASWELYQRRKRELPENCRKEAV